VGDPEEAAQQQVASAESTHSPATPAPQDAAESPWDRIKRHKVVEWALAYIAFGYAALHGSQMLRDTLEWPASVPRFTLFALLLGFPIAVTLAWYHGHRAQHRLSRIEIAILAALLLTAGSVLWFVSRYPHEHAAATTPPNTQSGPAFAPPPHSIAVLPFTNLSGDPKQEYFSDGVSEELINALSHIEALQVTARTSSFSFKGQNVDISTIARRLNVAAILEGSIREDGHTVRITAQLINAASGFHMWSEDYDRDLKNLLVLQSDIATTVARQLRAKLLGDEAAKMEAGGTRNPAAFDAYLRGRKAIERSGAKAFQDAIAAYTEAIRLDPNYALAFAVRSIVYSAYTAEFATGAAIRQNFGKALGDARKALALAPDLPESHLALAVFFDNTLELAQASDAYERARTIASGNARVLRLGGLFAVYMGHFEPGLTALRREAVLDPLDPGSHNSLSLGLYYSRRYQEAIAAATDAISLDSGYQAAYGLRGMADYGLGDLEGARASCEAQTAAQTSQQCLAIVYDKLGRHTEAEAMLAKLKASMGDADAYQYATVYAQWGKKPKALEWLDTAMRLRDSGLALLKTDPLMDPLRQEPRFQALMQELKFPQ
jgi:TolB-like protein/Tfp pilus assembly protein PilF